MLSWRLFDRLRDERGISLVMAMGIMLTLSLTTVGMIRYTTVSVTHSSSDNAGTSAYQLAEEGINNALAVLNNQLDPDTGAVTGISPGVEGNETLLFPPDGTGHIDHPELRGSVDYVADLVVDEEAEEDYVWTITSTGTVTSGTTVRTRTLTRTVAVHGLNAGADAASWSRFYQDDASVCLTINTVNFPTAVATRGNLCMINGASVTGAGTTVNVGGNVSISGPDANTSVRYPTSASGPGTPAWVNPTRVGANDSSLATYALGASGATATSTILTAGGFGFTIPSNAIIRGIRVEIQHMAPSGCTSTCLRDEDVYLTKNGTAPSGNDYAVTGTSWDDVEETRTYGSTSDLWGTTWTAANINAATFGVRFRARNYSGVARTAYLDYIRITVTYSADTNGIGTAGTPIASATIAGSCTYNASPPSSLCSSADHVNAVEMIQLAEPDNPALDMPEVDLPYWFENAKPGPNHYCTNANPNMGDLVFDDDNPPFMDSGVNYNDADDDITPTTHDYTCQVVENGVLVGELSWNRTTRVLTIKGTIFFDGDVRFDGDGQVVHYQGRGIIYAADDVEFDEQVCAGGSGATSCVSGDMAAWSPNTNLLVVMSGGDSEYDVGDGAYCSPAGTATCSPQNNPVGAFQGVVAALGTCTIHQSFRLSGPVICNRLTLPTDSDGWPQYFAFPSLGPLVDGQKYRDTSTATNFELANGAQLG